MSRDWSLPKCEWPGDGRTEPFDPYQYFQQEGMQGQQATMLYPHGSVQYQPDSMPYTTPSQTTQPFEFLQPCITTPQKLQSPPNYQTTAEIKSLQAPLQYHPIPQLQLPAQLQPPPQLQSPPQLMSPPFLVPVAGPSGVQRVFKHGAPSMPSVSAIPRGDTPREMRNKAEKQRRDKLNQSIAELAAMVPPVKAASRRIDKTGVLRLTAHYLRAQQYVFGDSIPEREEEIHPNLVKYVLKLIDGFLITLTYRGLVVVVSQNVHQYLGYNELDLLGHSIMNITHVDDQQMLRQQLMPEGDILGPSGELLVGDDPEAIGRMNDSLAKDRRQFSVRFKKLTQRSEPPQYLSFYVEGAFRKADKAGSQNSRCCQMVRRARARGDNPCSSGNDLVFIGLVRPSAETFLTERKLEAFRMEYRTRHSVDGEIIQCEQKISLITGYMTDEVHGINAMTFMHRDDVQWVLTALRDMYDQHRLMGESCYRLMTKNGQFIYMKTKGCLEVDVSSNTVTTFVCTNVVVDEVEGKKLISLMKKKLKLLVLEEGPKMRTESEGAEKKTDDQQELLEDPRVLEKVILRLFDNTAPSSFVCSKDSASSSTSKQNFSPSPPISIVPPRPERIVSCIEKISTIIKTRPGIGNIAELLITNRTQTAEQTTVIKTVPKEQTQTNSSPKRRQRPDIVVPNLVTFENTFMKNTYEEEGLLDSVPSVSKVSDQILNAVQLHDASTSKGGPMVSVKRPGNRDDDEVILTCKRKTVDVPISKAPDEAQKTDENEVFDASCIESLLTDPELNDALSFLQAMGNNETTDHFSDALLEQDFQELFGGIDGDNLANDESPSF